MPIRRGRRLSAVGAVVAGLLALAATSAGPAGAAPALPPFHCGPVSGGSSAATVHISNLRVTAKPGFDRLVVEFTGSAVPAYVVAPQSTPIFHLDLTGRDVVLKGTAGLKVSLFPATAHSTYLGPTDVITSATQMLEPRRLRDFDQLDRVGHRSATLVVPTRADLDRTNPAGDRRPGLIRSSRSARFVATAMVATCITGQ